jgi:GNAT superfamily N-acetyltransferase
VIGSSPPRTTYGDRVAGVMVREAVIGDLDAVHALYRQLYAELDLPLDDRVRRQWADTLGTPRRAVLVAELDGCAIGTADVTLMANAARARPYLLVENVVVAEGHRGAGIGRALLDTARERARAAGCYKLQLAATEDPAYAFYEAAGMRHDGRTYKDFFPDGAG